MDGEGLTRGKVTRTRGADAAASVARAVMVLDCLEESDLRTRETRFPILKEFQNLKEFPFWKDRTFEDRICIYAASGGHLDVLQWARSREYPWDHTQMSRWPRCPGGWTSGTCESAAKNGHLAILQWARAQGCPWDKRTCTEAAKNGHLEVLQWARAQGCPWAREECAWDAERYKRLAVLQWARTQRCP